MKDWPKLKVLEKKVHLVRTVWNKRPLSLVVTLSRLSVVLLKLRLKEIFKRVGLYVLMRALNMWL